MITNICTVKSCTVKKIIELAFRWVFFFFFTVGLLISELAERKILTIEKHTILKDVYSTIKLKTTLTSQGHLWSAKTEWEDLNYEVAVEHLLPPTFNEWRSENWLSKSILLIGIEHFFWVNKMISFKNEKKNDGQ